MERKEAYEQIKKLGLQEECKKMYGKNFTQCKTCLLEYIINRFSRAKAETEVVAEAKPIETIDKDPIKIRDLNDSFNKLLAILRKRHILLESDVKEILG